MNQSRHPSSDENLPPEKRETLPPEEAPSPQSMSPVPVLRTTRLGSSSLRDNDYDPRALEAALDRASLKPPRRARSDTT